MELRPSLECANYPATQDFPKFLWNQNVRYCVHKSSVLVCVLNQVIPVRTYSFRNYPSIYI
jgi:hypothetical protein